MIIVVIGYRQDGTGHAFWSSGVGEGSGMEPHPTISPEPGGGGWEPPLLDMPHEIDCSTSDGAATSVANGIKATDDVVGPTEHTWRNVEYGAAIVQNQDASFGAFDNKIFTKNMPDRSGIPVPGLEVNVLGIVHNHPNESGGDAENLNQRYPSTGDWDALDLLFGRYSSARPAYNPVIWVIDPLGVVRRFSRSERAQFDSLGFNDRQNGVGLSGKEVDTPCQQAP